MNTKSWAQRSTRKGLSCHFKGAHGQDTMSNGIFPTTRSSRSRRRVAEESHTQVFQVHPKLANGSSPRRTCSLCTRRSRGSWQSVASRSQAEWPRCRNSSMMLESRSLAYRRQERHLGCEPWSTTSWWLEEQKKEIMDANYGWHTEKESCQVMYLSGVRTQECFSAPSGHPTSRPTSRWHTHPRQPLERTRSRHGGTRWHRDQEAIEEGAPRIARRCERAAGIHLLGGRRRSRG